MHSRLRYAIELAYAALPSFKNPEGYGKGYRRSRLQQ